MDGARAVLAPALVVLGFGLAYFAPSLVAFGRGHPARWAILPVNALLGITGVGWGIAFIWSVLPREPVGDAPPGT